MLENAVKIISSLQAVKNKDESFKTQTGTALDYDKYSELFISDLMIHNNKLNKDNKFGSKYRRSFYELEKLPNDGNEASFNIDSSVDVIQAYTS